MSIGAGADSTAGAGVVVAGSTIGVAAGSVTGVTTDGSVEASCILIPLIYVIVFIIADGN